MIVFRVCISSSPSVASLICVEVSSVTGRNWSAFTCSASCSACPRWSIIITTSLMKVPVWYAVGRYALLRVSARYLWACGCLSCMLHWDRTFWVEASFAGVVYGLHHCRESIYVLFELLGSEENGQHFLFDLAYCCYCCLVGVRDVNAYAMVRPWCSRQAPSPFSFFLFRFCFFFDILFPLVAKYNAIMNVNNVIS